MIASQSPMVKLAVRAASPLAIMAGLYLLFAGHNQPGGGFAAGLVFSAVIALRTVTGLQQPTNASGLIAAGLAVICATAAAPLLFGDALLDQKIFTQTIPLLGKVKTGSALPFDIGVAAVVVGLVISLLDGLDAAALARDPRPAANAPSPETEEV